MFEVCVSVTSRNAFTLLNCALLVALGATLVAAQDITAQGAKQTATIYSDTRLQGHLRGLYKCVESRMNDTNAQRVTYSGTLTYAKGKAANVSILWEAPGTARYTDATAGKAVVFDGSKGLSGSGAPNAEESELLELFAIERLDTVLYQLKGGSSGRLVGLRFRSGSGATSTYDDIYEITAAEKVRSDRGAVQRKFLHLDSATGLPRQFRYRVPGSGTLVQTQFSDWRIIGGHNVPGKITRLQDGSVTYTFVLGTATFGPAVKDGQTERVQ